MLLTCIHYVDSNVNLAFYFLLTMFQWCNGLLHGIINWLLQYCKSFTQRFIHALTQTLKVCNQLRFSLRCTRQHLKTVQSLQQPIPSVGRMSDLPMLIRKGRPMSTFDMWHWHIVWQWHNVLKWHNVLTVTSPTSTLDAGRFHRTMHQEHCVYCYSRSVTLTYHGRIS